MKKVFLTFPFPEDWIGELRENVQVYMNPDKKRLSEEELIANFKERDGVITLLSDKITRRVIEKANKLKVISNYAVGYDNIDIEFAKERGIIVTNTPDVLTNATAELTISLILAVAKRIVEADRFTREGKFEGWQPTLLLGREVKDSYLGILGAGRIGIAVAKKAYSLGMNVIYYSRKEKDEMKALNAKFVSLDYLLKTSDFISLHLPLTKETYHIIGEKEFKAMKQNSIIINTGRGALIDEASLAEALLNNKIGGAGLDVYEFEPGVTTMLLKFQNVILTPHIGSATYRTRKMMAKIAVKNVLSVLNGKEPLYRVV